MSVRGYKLTKDGAIPLITSASTLDGLTRELPEGFYTTFTTNSKGRRVLGLADHLKRLFEPAAGLNLHPSALENVIREQLALLVEPNLPNESRVRLILTRDSGEVLVGIQPFTGLASSIYSEGVHVITTGLSRHDPRIKDTAFLAESAVQRNLLGREVFEVLMTRNGRILEGLTSNFYAIEQNVLITARQGVLPGVTRKAVLRLAGGQGMRIAYRAPAVHEKFEEAFLTSSSRGVVPVVSIDHVPVGEGRVGEWTKRLSRAYQKYVEERSENIAG